MPRVSPALIRQSYAIDRLLAPLLPACRDLASARNELRWLKEHAAKQPSDAALALRQCVARRASGEPLQYILGSEYFGDLEIKCRPGVLIPRPDTAAAVTYLVGRLSSIIGRAYSLRMLDLCTGSGCVPLLFHHELYRRHSSIELEMRGVDLSPLAISLARDNLQRQIKEQSAQSGSQLKLQSLRKARFVESDIFANLPAELWEAEDTKTQPSCEILISNPPYISTHGYLHTTTRSVRNFEPKLALVPPTSAGQREADGDLFYPRLLELADLMQSRVVLFEVSDLEQASRVASLMVLQGHWDGVEIWLDNPAASVENASAKVANRSVQVKGAGIGRSVFAYRG